MTGWRKSEAVWSVDRPLVGRLVDGPLEADRPNSSGYLDRPTFLKKKKSTVGMST